MSETSFSNALATLVRKEMMQAVTTGDVERQANVLERLMHSAGMTIALFAGGDPKRIEKLAMGSESHLIEEAARYAKIGDFLASLHP